MHAQAHVHYETGDHLAGLAWLDGWITDRGARPRTGRTSPGTRRCTSWPWRRRAGCCATPRSSRRRRVSGVRALVDSASLLWRIRMTGAAPAGDLAALLRALPEPLLTTPPTPFVALHAAIALAATGDCRRLVALRRHARSGPAAMADLIAPLADALCDVVHDDPERALDTLLGLGGADALIPLGGSAAQREIVQETLIHCAIAGGRPDIAADVLTLRIERRNSPADRRRRDVLLRSSAHRRGRVS